MNTPDDLAKAAVFLASDDAAMITGTCIEVDGGRSHLTHGRRASHERHSSRRGLPRRALGGDVRRVRGHAHRDRPGRVPRPEPLQPAARGCGVGGAQARQ